MDLKRMAGVLLCLMLASGASSGIAGASEKEKVIGKTFYFAANIHYDDPKRIDSTNYLNGKFILPMGTVVTIREVRDTVSSDVLSANVEWERTIRFVDQYGGNFTMIFNERHAANGQTVWTLFEQYFTAEDPMVPGGPFSSLSFTEQENVKKGKIATGMSKKAVLMAVGYPPGHRTPSLSGNVWVYWANRIKPMAVMFEDDMVVRPRGAKVGQRLPIEERLKKLDFLLEKGLITKEEYAAKRADILKDL